MAQRDPRGSGKHDGTGPGVPQAAAAAAAAAAEDAGEVVEMMEMMEDRGYRETGMEVGAARPEAA